MHKTIGAVALLSMLLSEAALAQTSPATQPTAMDMKTLPPDQWVERPLTGWKGKDYYGNELVFGWTAAGEHGLVVLDIRKEHAGRAIVRKLDPASGAWTEPASAPIEVAFKDTYGGPVEEFLHGIQLCYDSDRKTLVGLTSTDLDGRGRTIEFDLAARTAIGHKPNPSPPVVTAGSLCYDPVNKEVVLATGGFSPVGGTDGTWLYDGATKQWRRLQTPADIDEVRLPLEEARDRLITLRWLVWKNLEFRATGRDKLLDDRARSDALAKEAAELAGEFRRLGEQAMTNAGRARRQYHKGCLSAAARLLDESAGKLTGVDARLKSASPEEAETLYRGNVVPALESADKALSQLAVTPEPRMNARLVFDAGNRLIVCFGGNGQRRGYADTWVYHCEGRWWERRHPRPHPSPAESRAAAYVEGVGVVVNWRYVYDASANEWRQFPGGGPKGGLWMEYDASAGCLVAMNSDWNKAAVFRPDASAAKPVDAKDTPEVNWVDVAGEFVLRDAATVADLKKWQGETADWVKGVPASTWVTVPTHGTGRPNWGRSWSSIVYDPDRWQLYYRDGGHGSYHGAVTDHYDLPTGRWFRSDLRDSPPWPMGTYFGWGRAFSLAPWCIHSYKYNLFYNPLTSRLQRTIGQSGRMEGAPPGAVLDYDPDTGRWARQLQPVAGGAGGALGGGGIVPGVPDAMLGIDNFTRYGQKDGAAMLATESGVKTFGNLGALPRAWEDHCFCWFYDPQRKRVMYYGGPKDKPQQLSALDLTAEKPRWVNLNVKPAEEGGKLPLSSREIVHVSRHDVFLMLEGGQQGKPVAVWALDARTSVFAPAPLAGPAPKDAGVSQGLQYDPVADLCFYIQAAPGVPVMQAFRYMTQNKQDR